MHNFYKNKQAVFVHYSSVIYLTDPYQESKIPPT